ncbi:MAG TPA: porin [Gemmatimonadaceae bacterium]|nr:porin [Gemmatimonadaceae bacterium]
MAFYDGSGADEVPASKLPIEVPAAATAPATELPPGCESATDLTAYWKDGLRMDTCDGNFRFKLGGRAFIDGTVWDANDEIETAIGDDIRNGTRFRAARLYIAGEIYEYFVFKAEYDFASDAGTDFKDVYIGVQDVLLDGSEILVGNNKVPFSLEELTSSRFITFMERGLPNMFAASRETGLHLATPFLDDRVVAAFSLTQTPDDTQATHTGNDFNVVARLAGVPYYGGEDRLVHVGAAYSYSMLEDDEAQFRQRPEVRQSPRFVDTGVFDADDANTVGVEAATVLGPVSLQGEYMRNFVDSDATDDPSLWGYYVFASFFLTGEHRQYKLGEARFDRVKVKRNLFAKGGGFGAWEVGLRYSYLNLNDELADGGILGDVTAGVNWYLNPNMRIMFNYVYADLDDVDHTNAFTVRTQVDF